MNRAKRIASLVRTMGRLGYGHAAVVAGYRLALRGGWLDRQARGGDTGPFLRNDIIVSPRPELAPPMAQELEELRDGRLRLLGHGAAPVESPPDWFRNRLSGAAACRDKPWWQASDFDHALGDIKGVWELSRFDWAIALSRAAIATGDMEFRARLEQWIEDWTSDNPAYFGANWMCGQETSIRLMQLLLALRLLDQDREPLAALRTFVSTHLSRIALTRLYADAQDNNHAISEAMALFAGGAWLFRESTGAEAKKACAWSRLGRTWLENLIRRLVFSDGGFSQYSLNYHRLALDALCQAELWRQRLELESFSPMFLQKCAAMVVWLSTNVNAHSGDAPVLGANDGAHAFRLTSLGYRDYRPSVQLAAQIFCGRRAYLPGPWDETLDWLKLPPATLDKSLACKRSRYFPDFGLVLLNPRADGTGSYAFVRVPKAQFRPSQADTLHFDLWTENGENLLRDAGSASYFDADDVSYFTGIASHNSIQFDERDPMPHLSRFLFADWIDGKATAPVVTAGRLEWVGSYRDAAGAYHSRSVSAMGTTWHVEDHISGFRERAVLRWRLAPAVCKLRGKELVHPGLTIKIESDAPVVLRLTEAMESRNYGIKTVLPCLEVEVGVGAKVIRSHIEVH